MLALQNLLADLDPAAHEFGKKVMADKKEIENLRKQSAEAAEQAKKEPIEGFSSNSGRFMAVWPCIEAVSYRFASEIGLGSSWESRIEMGGSGEAREGGLRGGKSCEEAAGGGFPLLRACFFILFRSFQQPFATTWCVWGLL